MNFRARTTTRTLDLGSCVTFMPAEADPAALPPPVPVGAAVPLALNADWMGADEPGRDTLVLTVEQATRTELVARTSDGRRIRLTPRTPTERGGFWEPGRGMSEWIVREKTR